jgi:hypothetical protein
VHYYQAGSEGKHKPAQGSRAGFEGFRALEANGVWFGICLYAVLDCLRLCEVVCAQLIPLPVGKAGGAEI